MMNAQISRPVAKRLDLVLVALLLHHSFQGLVMDHLSIGMRRFFPVYLQHAHSSMSQQQLLQRSRVGKGLKYEIKFRDKMSAALRQHLMSKEKTSLCCARWPHCALSFSNNVGISLWALPDGTAAARWTPETNVGRT